jgi:probable HAF family extracellular repeat protein
LNHFGVLTEDGPIAAPKARQTTLQISRNVVTKQKNRRLNMKLRRSYKSRMFANLIAMTLLAATPVCALPQGNAVQEQKATHHHYKFVDLGTFGGPNSGVNGEPSVKVINNAGTVVGVADTPIPTSVPGGFNPIGRIDFFISHAFVWRGGSLKDLGTLPGGDYSFAAAINQLGQIAGTSENSQIDPASGNPEFHAVLWQNDKILDLGTLGGTASFAATLNDRGQVIGEALNDVPDPLSILGTGDGTTLTQTRAFLWEKGKMHDLGTLGGPDSWAMYINDRGQVTGTSYTSDVVDPNALTPQTDPYLWEDGRMKDLGNFGGTNSFLGPQFVQALNNRGQVVGIMALAGDQVNHAFFWDGEKLSDLGTFGGSGSIATGINDAGTVVGYAFLPGDRIKHAFLWRNGAMTDLGTVLGDPCSFAFNINSGGQIVGGSQSPDGAGGCINDFVHATLWENGESGVDLNTLIPPGSDLQLTVVDWINDRGEIVGLGHDPSCPNGDNCDGHAYVLIPCDENHPNIESCDYSLVAATPPDRVEPSQNTQLSDPVSPAKLSPAEMMTRFRSLVARRFGTPQPSPR